MKTGIELIADERGRQVTKEGYSADHDSSHTDASIVQAAVAYAYAASQLLLSRGRVDFELIRHMHWPWTRGSWRPSKDPVRNLVKAGALLAAEIDRLQASKSPASPANNAAESLQRTEEGRDGSKS